MYRKNHRIHLLHPLSSREEQARAATVKQSHHTTFIQILQYSFQFFRILPNIKNPYPQNLSGQTKTNKLQTKTMSVVIVKSFVGAVCDRPFVPKCLPHQVFVTFRATTGRPYEKWTKLAKRHLEKRHATRKEKRILLQKTHRRICYKIRQTRHPTI